MLFREEPVTTKYMRITIPKKTLIVAMGLQSMTSPPRPAW